MLEQEQAGNVEMRGSEKNKGNVKEREGGRDTWEKSVSGRGHDTPERNKQSASVRALKLHRPSELCTGNCETK